MPLLLPIKQCAIKHSNNVPSPMPINDHWTAVYGAISGIINIYAARHIKIKEMPRSQRRWTWVI